jgi:hypothetical protein
MAQTNQPPGWTSQFRELVPDIGAALHDLRGGIAAFAPALDPGDYAMAQRLAAALRDNGSDGVVYPSLAILTVFAWGYFIQTWRRRPCKGGTSIITGMAFALISSAMRGWGSFSDQGILKGERISRPPSFSKVARRHDRLSSVAASLHGRTVRITAIAPSR